MSQLLLLGLLFVLQFIILPFGISPFETPKYIIAEVTILILAFFVLSPSTWREYIHTFKVDKAKGILDTKMSSIYLVLLVIVMGSICAVILPYENTFFGNAFRGQGLFLFILLFLFSLISSRLAFPRIPRWLVILLLSGQILLSIFIDTKDGRAVGTLGEPNALAAFALFLR